MKFESTKIDYGPISGFLNEESITEIMINGWDNIYIEHDGVVQRTANSFVNEVQFQDLIDDIIENCSHRQISGSLFVDGVLPSGYRFNITLPPMSAFGPALTIRKFRQKIYSLNELVTSGALSHKAAHFLDEAVKARLNIVVSGGTGTGKTTILNSLCSSIPDNQRVITIQDVPELRLANKNWISLVSTENPQKVTSRDCLVNSLRMRPDRIIVGECRRDETFEMLQAMNTGHEGSMTTVHAVSAHEALTRIESLMMYARFEMPIQVLRYQISESIDLIVQLKRTTAGRREISEIIELTGMERDIITRGDVFKRNEKGELAPTGYVPACLTKINREKTVLPASMF